MATGRLAKILKSCGEFTDEEIARMTEDEAWHWVHTNTPLPRREACEPADRESSPPH